MLNLRRAPSRGAWIETHAERLEMCVSCRRAPSQGAWIEITPYLRLLLWLRWPHSLGICQIVVYFAMRGAF